MPTKRVGSGHASRGRDFFYAATISFFALVLLAGGTFSLGRELARIPSVQYVKTAADRLGSPDPDIRTEARNHALDLHESLDPNLLWAEDLRRRAGLHIMASKDFTAEGDRGAAIEAAREARVLLEQAVQRVPVDPLTWASLADAALTIEPGKDRQAFRLLETSYAMEPVDPDLLAYRFRLAIALRRHWDPRFFAMLRRDLNGLLRLPTWQPPARAFHAAAKTDFALFRLSQLLARSDPEMLENWERHAKRITR